MRITAASVVYNWIQRRIQPLQRRNTFGFEYQGTQDGSRLVAEPMEHAQALKMTKLIFPDQLHVPYVPTLFRATNPPRQVRL